MTELGFDCRNTDETLICGYIFAYPALWTSNFEERQFQRHDITIDATWNREQAVRLTPNFHVSIRVSSVDEVRYRELVASNHLERSYASTQDQFDAELCN